MTSPSQDQPAFRLSPGWLAAALAGSVAPAGVLALAGDARVMGPVFAVGMMGAGMIAAAVAGRSRVGVMVALLNGAALVLLAWALGLPAIRDPLAAVLAAILASVSFAVRGELFARSAAPRGWWVALAVVAGEAAVLLTAIAMPGVWPGWVLALLPAQWATLALRSALTGTGTQVAGAALIALAGTAAATALVIRLWPRRWTYLVMFTTWLGLSALVWETTL
ncbi:MAG: hypothetical protein EAY70_02285 [Sphingomonadales bacterium]|nr:MAG: hypothetical protein EAY70_02285 [Sphingomonadales bacterium]